MRLTLFIRGIAVRANTTRHFFKKRLTLAETISVGREASSLCYRGCVVDTWYGASGIIGLSQCKGENGKKPCEKSKSVHNYK